VLASGLFPLRSSNKELSPARITNKIEFPVLIRALIEFFST